MAPAVRYRVWVGGLPKDVQKDDLAARFSKYGAITDIVVRNSDHDTYSFITYTDREEAELAIARMDRSCAWGAPVKVNISKDFAPNGPRQRGADGKILNTAPARRPSPPARRQRSSTPPRLSSPRRESGRRRSRSPPIPPMRDFAAPRGYSPPPRHGGGAYGGGYGGPQRGYSPPPRDRFGPDLSQRYDRYLPPGRGYSPLPSEGYRALGDAHARRLAPSRGPRPRDYPPEPPPGPTRVYEPLSLRGYDDRHPGGLRPSRIHGRSPPPAALPRGLSTPVVGKHRITIENIPEDMGWLELKDLGREYGPTVTFSRTYKRGITSYGMIEFEKAEDAKRCISELDGRRIQGGTIPMRVTEGDSYNT